MRSSLTLHSLCHKNILSKVRMSPVTRNGMSFWDIHTQDSSKISGIKRMVTLISGADSITSYQPPFLLKSDILTLLLISVTTKSGIINIPLRNGSNHHLQEMIHST